MKEYIWELSVAITILIVLQYVRFFNNGKRYRKFVNKKENEYKLSYKGIKKSQLN